MKREDAVKLWKRIRFLSDIGRVQWEHREYLNSDDQRFLQKGIRNADLREAIKSARQELRHSFDNLDKRRRKHADTRNKILAIMGLDAGRRTGAVYFGKDAYASREKGSSGIYHYTIKVGHMWRQKVYYTLYHMTKLHKEKMLVLKSEKVRVNDKNINLYEVVAYMYEQDLTSTGYIAQTKTEKRHTAFGKTAKLAVQRANEMLSDEINKSLLH